MAEDKNGGPNFMQAWREHRGLSRDELAAHLDTASNVVWNLEVGERGLSTKWLRKIAPILDCTIDDLLGRHPNAAGELVPMPVKITPAQRRQIITMAETLVRIDADRG